MFSFFSVFGKLPSPSLSVFNVNTINSDSLSLSHIQTMAAAAVDTKHQGGGFEKAVSVVASGQSVCNEDNIRESSFRRPGVAKAYGHYITRFTAVAPKKPNKKNKVSLEAL